MGKLTRKKKLNSAKKLHKNGDRALNMTASQATSKEEDDSNPPIKKVYLPNNDYQNIGFDTNDNDFNDDLVYEPSAYQLYREFDLGFPCLSFSFASTKTLVPSNNDQDAFSANFVSGSQMNNSKNNEIIVGSITHIKYKNVDQKSSPSSSESSEEESESAEDIVQPNLKVITFPHQGSVNKIAASSFFNREYVANWSDMGAVRIYDITDEINHLYNTNKPRKNNSNKKPIFDFNGHQDEGYALDWSLIATAKLASGSCDSTIAIWNPNETTWQVDCLSSKHQFGGHSSSVECVQWSPNEKDILSSSGCDGYIKVWDTRSLQTKPVLSINAHPGTDVNVFAWNRHEPLLVSGDDNGILKVWDLRQLQADVSNSKQNNQAICEFSHHTKAITSVEWHPTDTSTFMSSGEDDQVVLWDLAVDTDNLNLGNVPESVLPQILFIHLGQSEIKECHWHPTHHGLIMSTAFKGFNIFKTVSV